MGHGCEVQDLIDLINEGAIYKFLRRPVSFPLLREILRKAFLIRERGAN